MEKWFTVNKLNTIDLQQIWLQENNKREYIQLSIKNALAIKKKAYHLISKHKNGFQRQFPTTEVKQILETGSQ